MYTYVYYRILLGFGSCFSDCLAGICCNPCSARMVRLPVAPTGWSLFLNLHARRDLDAGNLTQGCRCRSAYRRCNFVRAVPSSVAVFGQSPSKRTHGESSKVICLREIREGLLGDTWNTSWSYLRVATYHSCKHPTYAEARSNSWSIALGKWLLNWRTDIVSLSKGNINYLNTTIWTLHVHRFCGIRNPPDQKRENPD